MKTIIIGIAGGTGSGKTTLTENGIISVRTRSASSTMTVTTSATTNSPTRSAAS